MRERSIDDKATGPAVPAPRLSAEALRIAHLLRLGYDEAALSALDQLQQDLGRNLAALRLASHRPDAVTTLLASLQDLSLRRASSDSIGLADILEYDIARQLAEFSERIS